MKPITKKEVSKNLDSREFPDFVIQAFNECITESKTKGSTTVFQDDVIERIVQLGSVDKNTIFEKHWLDVENHYKKAGWKVKYEKPGFNEMGRAYFVFS